MAQVPKHRCDALVIHLASSCYPGGEWVSGQSCACCIYQSAGRSQWQGFAKEMGYGAWATESSPRSPLMQIAASNPSLYE